MRVTKAFMPLLIKAAENKDARSGRAADPRIVMIGSLAGVMPYVFGGAYNATKAALHAYSDTLRVEIEPFGSVTVIPTAYRRMLTTGQSKSHDHHHRRRAVAHCTNRAVAPRW